MKYLIITLFIFCTLVVYGKNIQLENLEKIENLYYLKSTKQPYTGEIIGLHSGKFYNGYIYSTNNR